MTKTKKINNMNKKHTRKNRNIKKVHKLKKCVKRTRKSLKKRRFRKRKTVRKIKRGGDRCQEDFIEKTDDAVNEHDVCPWCLNLLKELPKIADISRGPTNVEIRGGILYQLDCCQIFHAGCLNEWINHPSHNDVLGSRLDEEDAKIKCPGGCNYENISRSNATTIFAFIGNENNTCLGKDEREMYYTKEYLGNEYVQKLIDGELEAFNNQHTLPSDQSQCAIMG
jgi:hypothetical protein